MSRSVKLYDERRQEILETAQRLFYSQGYEATSIQSIIDQVGIAKGTFYHYFSSKTHLLDELVNYLVSSTMQPIEPLIYQPDLNALEKLHQFFFSLESWKLENKEFLLNILRAWYSDDNIVFRTRLERTQLNSFSKKFALIIEQGCQEGLFKTDNPPALAHIILAIMQDFSHRLLDALLLPEFSDKSPFDIDQHVDTCQRAIEQLLGATAGSIHILNPERLKQWF